MNQNDTTTDTPVVRKRYATTEQVADRYAVSAESVRRGVRDKRLPALRVGRQLRFDLDVLDALFAQPAEHEVHGSLTTTRPKRKPRRPAA
jgi:excisionase family DNA binding protein